MKKAVPLFVVVLNVVNRSSVPCLARLRDGIEVSEIELRQLQRSDGYMLDRRADFDFALLARRIISGIGRPFGFLRWMWLTKPFLFRNVSLAADR